MSYVIRPHAFVYVGDERADTAREVIVEERTPRFTGLYTASGDRIYRVEETVKFGFQVKA